MNDEIREILENVKKCCDITKEQSFTVYQRQDILKLLDYITNLQKENLALARENEKEKQFIKDCGFQNQQQLALMYLDYKSRVEKAVEYIHKNYYEIVYKTKGTMENDLLNILQNGSVYKE